MILIEAAGSGWEGWEGEAAGLSLNAGGEGLRGGEQAAAPSSLLTRVPRHEPRGDTGQFLHSTLSPAKDHHKETHY